MYKTMLTIMVMTALAVTSFAVGGGDITFTPPNSDPVIFSHDYHMKTRGIKCVACHFSTFSDESGSYKIKKEKLNKQGFCQHCHNGMKGFDAASGKNCKRCHKK